MESSKLEDHTCGDIPSMLLLGLILTHSQLTESSMRAALQLLLHRRSSRCQVFISYLSVAGMSKATESTRACIQSHPIHLFSTTHGEVRLLTNLEKTLWKAFDSRLASSLEPYQRLHLRTFVHRMSFSVRCRWRFCIVFVTCVPVNLHDQLP